MLSLGSPETEDDEQLHILLCKVKDGQVPLFKQAVNQNNLLHTDVQI